MAIHVLQIGPYPPPEGGVSRNLVAIRNELVKRGDRCSVMVISPSTTIVPEPDVYHQNSESEIIKLLASIKHDVLHLHVGGEVSRRILGLALASTVFAGRKSILTMHSGAYPLTDAAKTAQRLSARGAIFRRFGRIIAVNDQLVDVFRRYGVRDERIRMILPYSLHTPDKNIEIPQNLAEFFAAHDPVLLSVGGLEAEYDPLFQIEAMRDILKDFPNAGLLIAGDGTMRRDVETAVSASGYAGSVCIAGNVDHAVTLNLIARAAVMLRTTRFDGDAISVREALYLGTPVIATDNGMRPVGTNLIAIGDRAALVEKVREICGSKQKRPAQGTAENSNIKQVLDLYQELL